MSVSKPIIFKSSCACGIPTAGVGGLHRSEQVLSHSCCRATDNFIGDQNGEIARILRRKRCGRVVAIGGADGPISEIWRMKLDESYRQRAGETLAAVQAEVIGTSSIYVFRDNFAVSKQRIVEVMKYFLTLVLLLFVFSVRAEAQNLKVASQCFRIFDGSAFRGKPDLSQYGIEPASVIYAPSHFWPGKKNMDRLPPRSAVRSMIRERILSRPPVAPITVIDIEHWPNTGEASVVEGSLEKYLTLLQWVQEDIGGAAVTYYGIPPLRDYWRAIQDPSSTAFKQWQSENDRFTRLAEAVDVLTPSLYTFYEDSLGWERYAIANVQEARRLANGKPIYPFIWPQYHDSSKLKGYLPKSYWLRQLQVLERIADGAVIWAGLEPWDPDAEWWQATLEFMQSSPRVCKGTA